MQARNEENQRRAEENKKRREAEDRETEERGMARCSAFWLRVRQAAEANGVDLRRAFTALKTTYADVDEMLDYARGDAPDIAWVAEDLLDVYLEELADELHCSTDYVLGRTDDPKPPALRDAGGGVPCTDTPRPDDEPAAPAATWPTVWQTGTPDKEGWYAVHATWRGDGLYHEQLYWRSAWWEDEKCKYTDKETTVLRFFPLPQEDAE